MQIKPLVEPTTIIYDLDGISYSWHDVLSKRKEFRYAYCYVLVYLFVFLDILTDSFVTDNHNALTILSLWAPVFSVSVFFIYF